MTSYFSPGVALVKYQYQGSLNVYSHGARRVSLLRVDQTNSKQLFWKWVLHSVSQHRVRSLRVCWTYFLKWAPGILSQIWPKGSDEQDEKWKIVKTEFLLKSVSLVMCNWWSFCHNAGYFVTSMYIVSFCQTCMLNNKFRQCSVRFMNKNGSISPPRRAAPVTGFTWVNEVKYECLSHSLEGFIAPPTWKIHFEFGKQESSFGFFMYMGQTGNILKGSQCNCAWNDLILLATWIYSININKHFLKQVVI